MTLYQMRAMTQTLELRRARKFRPVEYTARHQFVVLLHAVGERHSEVARLTGYSPSHISRIIGMPEAQADLRQFQELWRELVIDRSMSSLFQRLQQSQRERGRSGRAHPVTEAKQ